MSKSYVFDSTPLIYLGKVRILEKLKELKSRNLIPKSVFAEVVEKGREKGMQDAFYIEKLVSQKIFKISEVQENLKIVSDNPNLEPADIDVLSIAKELKGMAIIDDEEARAAAEIANIEKGGSIYILFRLLKLKIISKKDCRELIDKMIDAGWHCSTKMYAHIIKELEY